MSKNSAKAKGDKANMKKKKDKAKAKDLKAPTWYTDSPSQGADVGRKR